MQKRRMNTPELCLSPDDPKVFVCPVCGEECETVFTDWFNHYVGCNVCISTIDAKEYFEGD